MSQPFLDTAITDAEERANRAQRIADVLKHDLEKNPPAVKVTLFRAHLRCFRYQHEADRLQQHVKQLYKDKYANH